MFWLPFIGLAVLASALLVLPLWRRDGVRADDGSEGEKRALKAQLAEAESDLAAGLVKPREHELVRAEIARRLFRLDDRKAIGARETSAARPILLASAVTVPVAAILLYGSIGVPGLRSLPAEGRTDVLAGLARTEKYLARNPKDARMWIAVAPIYRRLNRADDAANAYRMALDADAHPPKLKAALLTEWAEARSLAAGRPVAGTSKALAEAVLLDPDNAKTRFMLAIATEEAGDREATRTAWADLLARFPNAEGGWVDNAKARLAAVEAVPPGGEAIAALPAAERSERIETMVAGLAERLEAEPDDLEGWLRLMRSYTVLGRADAATSAYDRALSHYSGRAAEREKLVAGARKLGLADR